MEIFKHLAGEIAAIIVALSVVVEITPIKLNPWSWIARKIGKAINHDVIEKVDQLEKKVNRVGDALDEKSAKDARTKILNFGDELIYNPERKHSKDKFDEVVANITEYEQYCSEHPDFKNHMTEATTKLILSTYETCMKKHSFL